MCEIINDKSAFLAVLVMIIPPVAAFIFFLLLTRSQKK